MDKLDLDFAALLVALTAFTGIVWAIDSFTFRKRRLTADPPRKEPVLVEYCRSFFPVILAVLLIRSFLAEPFRIPSSSMMPTLLIGDFILVNKFAYGLRLPVANTKFLEIGQPERGDVVVFRFPGKTPDDPTRGTAYIKRVIGLPGDEIGYHDKTVFVNGEPVPQEDAGIYVGEHSGRSMTGATMRTEHLPGVDHLILIQSGIQRGEGTYRVPEGHYFVLGDNRDNSEDGRYWGYVPEENLVGKAFLIWMNFDGLDAGVEWSRLGTVIH